MSDASTPPAGWYTLRYATRPPAPPAWMVIELRLDAAGYILSFAVNSPRLLTADEAAAARAVPLPEGLELAYTGAGGG